MNLRLRRNVWILGTIGAIAPFIGLFGTVVGIMQAFRHMAATGQGFTVVASGISEALVATAGGIAVAIEAVVIYNFLNVHVGKLALQLKLVVEEFLETLHECCRPGGRGRARRRAREAQDGDRRGRTAAVAETSSRRPGGIFADINITPLTDIFLVLLIIFMVTTTAIAESGAQGGRVRVNLPKGAGRPPPSRATSRWRCSPTGAQSSAARCATTRRCGRRSRRRGASPETWCCSRRTRRAARPRRAGDGARAGRPEGLATSYRDAHRRGAP